MPKSIISLVFILAMLGLLIFTAGCTDHTPTESATKLLPLAIEPAPDVQLCADYHNSEVERLIQLDRTTGCLSEHLMRDYRSTIQDMTRRDPRFAPNEEQIRRSAEILGDLFRIHSSGHQPQNVIKVLNRCFAEFDTRENTHPKIIKNIQETLDVLLTGDSQRVNEKLSQLKSLTDDLGSLEEIGVVGVFLGSYERSMNKRYEDPNQPWWWRWVIYNDVIGTFAGGPTIGALFSSWAELIYMDMFPPGSHP